MINPCLDCKRKAKCKKWCNYKRDYNKHRKRIMKENKHLYNFDTFLKTLDNVEVVNDS